MKTSFFYPVILLLLFLLPLGGFSQWSTNPAVNNTICNLAGEQAIPKIATCANGDTYIGYYSNESGNYNVRLQRLDVLGNILWPTNGILISANPQDTWLTDWDMTCDAANHAILAFNDIRTGNWNIVAYRISPSGSFVWGANGIMLSNTISSNMAPKVISTAAGNLVFAWQVDNVIIMQKLSPSGTLLWGTTGITLSSPNSLTWPQLMPVGADDVILKYFDDIGPGYSPTRHVLAQRYSSAGTPVWGSAAAISIAGGISAWTQIFPFINDGSDGFYIAWHDDRDNNMKASIFVQHVSNTGALLYQPDGVEVSNVSTMNHYYPQLALPTGSSDVFVYWNEMNGNQDQWGIFGQKINSAGVAQWGAGGLILIPVSATNVYPYEARKSPTDMILIYEEYVNSISGMIKAMRISPSGAMLWTPAQKDICTVSSEKIHPVVNEFANNQWIATWEDNRSGNSDIYAQNIQLDGSLGPASFGTISGTISLNGGMGNVAQVTVQAGTTTATPDATGHYTMNVVTGTYTVTASLPGYYSASQSNVAVLINQTATVDLTLVPMPMGYIQGTVALVNGYGIMTNVLVSAGPNTTHPDQFGAYILLVAPGIYDVIASLATYIPDTVYNVAVANQQTVSGINFALSLAPTNGLMTGTVTLNGGTGNVAQVVVSAGGVASTNPNAAGFYSLDLPAGNYDVTASLGGYTTQTLMGIPVFVNQTTTDVNFTLVSAANSGNIQGFVTIGGEPADVALTNVSAGGYATHPNGSGNYDLPVPAGTYAVTATHPYTTAQTIGNVVVAPGQATPGVNFMLTVNRADLVVVAIVNPGGSTMNDVGVIIQGPEGPYTGTILSDSLVFLHVPYGAFNGSANFGGMYHSFSDTIIGPENHRLQFVFNLSGLQDGQKAQNLQVNPNPAGPTAEVCFTLPTPGKWKLELIDARGSIVSKLSKQMDAGTYRLPLRGINGKIQMRAGVYCLRLTGKNELATMCRMVYIEQ